MNFENPSDSWKEASALVSRLKLIPAPLHSIISLVFGKYPTVGSLQPGNCYLLEEVIVRAAKAEESYLNTASSSKESNIDLQRALKILGDEQVAIISFIYVTSRKLAKLISYPVWHALVDEIELRMRIGYLLGQCNIRLSPPLGLLIGFSSRFGFAVLLSSERKEDALKLIERIAAGSDLDLVCNRAFGCSQYQVAALLLGAAGFNPQISTAISEYSSNHTSLDEKTISYLWYSALSMVNASRGKRLDEVREIGGCVFGMNADQISDFITGLSRLWQNDQEYDWLLNKNHANE